MHKEGDILRDRYRLIMTLGSGGSGRVYLSEDLHLDKQWAVKEIPFKDEHASLIAGREIELLKAISHPAFPKIVDAWTDKNCCYIVSDYIDGLGLDKIIAEGTFSKKHAYKVAARIADALFYLHNLDTPVLYLDLKPNNVILKPDGSAYLIDFGISAFKSGMTLNFGTPGYAPPEQYNGADLSQIDERADIYAFGVTYFVMRTGLPPDNLKRLNTLKGANGFKRGDSFKNANKVKEAKKDLTHFEKYFIARCTQKNPAKRFKSIAASRRFLDFINFKHTGKTHILTIILLIIFFLSAVFFIPLLQKKDSLDEMLAKLPEYVNEEGYSDEGLRLVADYINSGCLSHREEQYYSFEIAREYFEVRHDYREAKRYFLRLDEDEYPQREYYLCICNLQTGFDYDEDALKECLDDFTAEINLSADNENKYINLLFAAFCYENYLGDLGKAADIVNNGLRELYELKESPYSGKWVLKMTEKYTKRGEKLGFR